MPYGVKITGLGAYVPDGRLTNDDLQNGGYQRRMDRDPHRHPGARVVAPEKARAIWPPGPPRRRSRMPASPPKSWI